MRFSDPAAAPAFPGIPYGTSILAETQRSVTQHFERQTLTRGLPQLKTPALFIHGRMDPLPVSASEESAALMPLADLHIIEDCGHFLWIEYPGLVGELAAHELNDR